MDIKRDTPKRFKPSVLQIVIVITALFVLIGFYINGLSQGPVLDRDAVRVAKVAQGDMQVAVRGAGVWKPAQINFIDTQVAGRVDQIVKYAGDAVASGDIIMVLSNPQIERQFEEADLALSAARADHKALSARVKSQLLDRQAKLMELTIELESANMELDANRELNKRHKALVAEIDFKRAELRVSQLRQMTSFQTQLLAAYTDNVDAEIEASLARVNQVERVRARAKNLVEGLTITASIDGVVQDNPLKVGQRVTEGQPLAKVVNLNSLYAEVRLPAQRARDVKSGLMALVNTRYETLAARVTRVDPNVINGQIKVDLAIDLTTPASARPDMELTATVVIAELGDTLHVARPFQLETNQISSVYVVQADGVAVRKPVSFGEASATSVQVLDGLSAGDQILVSDTSLYREYEVLTLR